ncbi:uncharacterized protein LOC143285908 [Babylonia areolata]|uniref:uncharacterized protein LOC143285908 n=1 Tax=Babylonia areolata TaxID=304850 RepID=UPI003FD6BF21
MADQTVLARKPFPLLSHPGPLKMPTLTQLLVVVVVLSLALPVQVAAFGTCRSSFRCLNGGEERYGQSIFGPCRCRCRPGYTGPRCQYREVTRKRSSSLNILNDFLQARLRAQRDQQRQQERRQQQLQTEDAFLSADHDAVSAGAAGSRRRRSEMTLLRLFSRR